MPGPSVYEAAYARFRQAEALLAGRGSRDEAAMLLARAREMDAGAGDTAPLRVAIEGSRGAGSVVTGLTAPERRPAGGVAG